MAKTKVIFVPWYVNEWIASTYMMRPVEYVFYHRALMQYYLKGKPLTQTDIDRLISDVSADVSDDDRTMYRTMCQTIIEDHFVRESDGLYHNAKADEELEKINKKSSQAKAAVEKREQKKRAKINRSSNDVSDDQSDDQSNDDLTNNHNPITNTVTTTSTDVDVVTPPALDALHSPDLFEQDSSETSDIVELDNDGVPVDPPKTKKRRGGESAALPFCEAITSFPDEWKKYIADVRPDLDPEKIFAEFSFYWTVGKGKDKRRTVKGWSSTWQTWIRRQDEPRQVYKPAPMPKRSNPILRMAEEFAAIDYHEGINPDGSF